jgi:tetratricopeptide (TPR) repeat protein
MPKSIGFIVNDGGIIFLHMMRLVLTNGRTLQRLILIVFLIVLPAVSFQGQPSSGVIINSDIRLFTTMAALNVAGYDVELAAQYHPVREAVRKLGENLDASLVQRLKTFYTTHKGNQPDDAQLPKYISLAVNLSNPPDFKPIVREELLPPDARSVADFVPLLQEFYEKAAVSERREQFRPEYQQEINELGPLLREMIVAGDSYLRVPLGGAIQQTMSIYVELAAPVNSVNVRSYQDDYYVVMGSATSPRIDDVRHAYLHFQLDGLIARSLPRIQNGNALLALVARAAGVQREYVNDFYIMTAESLIRAVELRMDRVAAVPAHEAIDGYYRSGLLLAPYFYEALGEYEQREESIREYLPVIASAVSVKDEQIRFQEKFAKIPVPERIVARPEVPEPLPEPPVNPMRELLRAGETAFNTNDNAAAKAAFEKVLNDFDRSNGAALYGLALIASKDEDSEAAQDLFDRTIRSNSAEPGMKVWSYIFLARIFDLECNREKALEYYQQAVKIGDNTRNAQTVAGEGLKAPFGGGCR